MRHAREKGEKMATNFSFADGVKLIAKGDNCAELEEFGKRFPQLTVAISKVVSKAGEDFVELANHFPDFLTAQKVNKVYKEEIRAVADDSDDAEDDEPTEPKPKRKPGRPRKNPESETVEDDEETGDDDVNGYADMTAKQLYAECKKRGISAEPKKAAKYYIDLLEADDNGDDADDSDDDDDWDI